MQAVFQSSSESQGSVAGTALLLSGMQSRQTIIQDALEIAGWHVHGFVHPKEALEALKTTAFEAVFCDEQLRGASSAGMLVWVRRLLPDIPFYVLSNHYDPDRYRLSGEPTAALHFPPVLGQLPTPRGEDGKKTLQDISVPLAGNTAHVPLADLIEMLSLGKEQATIELGAGEGLITLNGSKLEHAVCLDKAQPLTGLPALAQLIELKDVDFRVNAYQVPKRPTVNLTTVTAMTEAARLADERRQFGRLVGEVQKRCSVAEEIAVGYLSEIHPAQGWGAEPERLFRTAQTLLEFNRNALKNKVTDMFVEAEDLAYVVTTFGGESVIIASCPPKAKGQLYRAVHEAVKAQAG